MKLICSLSQTTDDICALFGLRMIVHHVNKFNLQKNYVGQSVHLHCDVIFLSTAFEVCCINCEMRTNNGITH